MDGATIQARVNRGYGIAAAKVGLPHDLYRPSDVRSPIRLVNRVATLPAAFDARPSYKFQIPGLQTDAERYALVDGDQIQPGDYLVGPGGTVFVAALPPLMPIVCIACNAILSLRRLGAPVGFGAIPDRTDASAGETLLWEGWPASMRFGGRGRSGSDDLPGDLPSPEYMVMLPAIPDAPDPRPGDVIVDDKGRRLAVGWWESSELGWRIIARLMTAG